MTRISSPGMGARGKRERERRSATHLALHPQAAAVELDELSRQREAETGTLALARGVAHLAELLEDRLLVLWRDADPGVGDDTSTVPFAGSARTLIRPPSGVNF